MVKKKERNQAIAVLLILGVALLFFGGFIDSGFISSIGETSDSVLVPEIAVISCGETTLSNNVQINNFNIGSGSQDLFCRDVFPFTVICNPALEQPVTLLSEGINQGQPNKSLLGYSNWRDSIPVRSTMSFTCNQSRCAFGEPDVDNWFNCPPQSIPVYSVETSSGAFAQNWFNWIPAPLFEISSNPLNRIELVEDETISMMATCINDADEFGELFEASSPQINMPLNVFNKQLILNVDGVQQAIINTEGCIRNDIVTAVNFGGDKRANPLEQLTDEDGIFKTIGSLFVAPELPQISQLPQKMRVGEDFAFVHGWKEIPAFGNVIFFKTEQELLGLF